MVMYSLQHENQSDKIVSIKCETVWIDKQFQVTEKSLFNISTVQKGPVEAKRNNMCFNISINYSILVS